MFLPFALVQLGNAMVSMRRLNQYLVMEERSEEVSILWTHRSDNCAASLSKCCLLKRSMQCEH